MSDDLVERHEERLGEHSKRFADHIQRINELEERLAQLEQVVDTDVGAIRYEQLTKQDKVRKVRIALVNRAGGSGTARMTYGEVQSLLNNRPSPGHAYDLMELAGECDGFDYQRPDGPDNRIVVNMDDVNDDALIHAANNEDQRVPA